MLPIIAKTDLSKQIIREYTLLYKCINVNSKSYTNLLEEHRYPHRKLLAFH